MLEGRKRREFPAAYMSTSLARELKVRLLRRTPTNHSMRNTHFEDSALGARIAADYALPWLELWHISIADQVNHNDRW